MHARVIDYSLLALVLIEVISGLASFLVGKPEGSWLFMLHGVLGLAILVLLVWKVRRVFVRLWRPQHWDRATVVAALALVAVLATVLSGVIWTAFQWPLGYPNGLNWHVIFGLLLACAVLGHMALRFKPLHRRHFLGRRTALRYAGIIATGGLLWQGHAQISRVARLPGANRRFTGSREIGSRQGLAFPVTMWMLDNPQPLDVKKWRLHVAGAVAHPFELSVADLARGRIVTQDAILDCTGGWYSAQTWRGLSVGWLLQQARPLPGARAVSFVSVTGYRWSVPLTEAASLLLATHAGDEPLDHGHGAPLRLVAPGRRGFQWVKWVTEVRVLQQPDLGQWIAIFNSGL